MSSRRKKPRGSWSYTAGAGQRGCSVTVFERRHVGGPVYAQTWSQPAGRYIKKALGYAVRGPDGELIPGCVREAEAYALAQSAKLRAGTDDLRRGKVTLGQVLDLYLQHRSPRKGARQQKADRAAAAMWREALGASIDPHAVALADWERFIDQRTSGEIDARGIRMADPTKRRPVGARTVQASCNWLRWVINWAVKWRLPSGHYLMRENPLRGCEAPQEKNPRRPVASDERVRAIRAVANKVMMQVSWNGDEQVVPSHLGVVFDLAVETGRRLSAVLDLRYGDFAAGAGTARSDPLAGR